MREIKFRVRRKIKDLYNKHYDTQWEYIKLRDGMYDDDNYYIETLGQYTGLKDEEGVEIYEGDRYYFQAHNPIEGIFTEHENTVEDFIMDTMELMQLLDSDYISELLVIGNIHIDKQE